MYSIDDLKLTAERVRNAIDRSAAASASTPAGGTSSFWAAMLGQRGNYPDINTIMVCRRAGAVFGIGDDPQGSIEREASYSARMHHIFARMVSSDFVAGLPETNFGSPLIFEHDGVSRSANFRMNAATTHRVMELLKLYGTGGPIRMLEIGPGWGACVHQLHQALDIESCTIVDLPENLYISTIHLGTVMPERRLEFIDVSGGPIREIPERSICACLPGAIARIRAQYDLVLNSFSLQEMSLENVTAYIDWIESVLAEGGIFVSLNSHGKAGVEEPSDYRYGKFHIHHWDVFRPSPPGFFNTIPYEVVLARRGPQSPKYPDEIQNSLGWLMQLGLDQDLRPFGKAMVSGSIEPSQHFLLSEYNRFFCANDDQARLRIIEALRPLDRTPIWPFVAANFALVRGQYDSCNVLLQEAGGRGLSGFARVRAEVLKAVLARKAGGRPSLVILDGLDPEFAYPEVAAMVSTGDVDPMIHHANRVLRRQAH